jgi:hypothetical protein
MAVLLIGIVIVCLVLIIRYSYQIGALQASSNLYTKLHIKTRGADYLRNHSKLAMALELDAKDARILKLIEELQQTKHSKSIIENTVNLGDNLRYRKCAAVVDKVIDCLTAYDSGKVSSDEILKLLRFDLTKVVDLKYTYSAEGIKRIQEVLDNIAQFEQATHNYQRRA